MFALYPLRILHYTRIPGGPFRQSSARSIKNLNKQQLTFIKLMLDQLTFDKLTLSQLAFNRLTFSELT
jgi:hypothetical protein